MIRWNINIKNDRTVYIPNENTSIEEKRRRRKNRQHWSNVHQILGRDKKQHGQGEKKFETKSEWENNPAFPPISTSFPCAHTNTQLVLHP